MASQLLWWESSDRPGAILVVLHLPQTEILISWVASEQSPENTDLWVSEEHWMVMHHFPMMVKHRS